MCCILRDPVNGIMSSINGINKEFRWSLWNLAIYLRKNEGDLLEKGDLLEEIQYFRIVIP